MDVQLKELLEKIKTEGIKTADDKASEIIKAAEDKAAQIIRDAENKAGRIMAEAREENDKVVKSGKEALNQAARDLILKLSSKIQGIFDEITAKSTKNAYSEETLQEAIISMVKNWSEKKEADIEVLVSKDSLNKIEAGLKSKLAAELKKGVTIKPSSKIDAGFLISEKDGSAYYNFSAEGMAQMLSEYLNPKLAEQIKNAAK